MKSIPFFPSKHEGFRGAQSNLHTMRLDSFNIESDVVVMDDDVVNSREPYTWIVFYLLVANLWTIVLVAVPVLTQVGPTDYYHSHDHWYTGNDVLRFIEPVGGLLLNFFVFLKSGIFKKSLSIGEIICVFTFMFGASLYVQGAAFHSASNMYKNSLEEIRTDRDDDFLNPLEYYTRTVWEHGVSHYIYASGLAIVHLAQAWAYRNVRAPPSGLTALGAFLLCCSSTVFAMLLFAVALQFPSGTIVGFIYLFLYGLCTVGGYHVYLYVYKDEHAALKQFGHIPVLNHFLAGYIVAFVALILWIIAVGGFKSRVEA